jgi:hypothetical protein
MAGFLGSNGFGAAALAAVGMSLIATSAVAASPFDRLGGSWSGSGAATFEGGQKERLTCNGYYRNQGGTKLNLALRCASPSTKIEVRGNLTYSGGQVTGSWEERTYNAAGTASGSGSDAGVNLNFSGSVSGSMRVSVSGSSQSVAINYQGIALKSVNMSLGRR